MTIVGGIIYISGKKKEDVVKLVCLRYGVSKELNSTKPMITDVILEKIKNTSVERKVENEAANANTRNKTYVP
ncbi:hypothetical protein OAA99_02135 [Omnitrophica bacterium]|nr:hypothetical protein [Candidatus Omnitrophota bacterium]